VVCFSSHLQARIHKIGPPPRGESREFSIRQKLFYQSLFFGYLDGELEIGTAILKDGEVDILVKRNRALMLTKERNKSCFI